MSQPGSQFLNKYTWCNLSKIHTTRHRVMDPLNKINKQIKSKLNQPSHANLQQQLSPPMDQQLFQIESSQQLQLIKSPLKYQLHHQKSPQQLQQIESPFEQCCLGLGPHLISFQLFYPLRQTCGPIFSSLCPYIDWQPEQQKISFVEVVYLGYFPLCLEQLSIQWKHL